MIHGVAGSSWCITLQGDLWLRISDSSHVLPNGKVVLRMCLAFPYCCEWDQTNVTSCVGQLF